MSALHITIDMQPSQQSQNSIPDNIWGGIERSVMRAEAAFAAVGIPTLHVLFSETHAPCIGPYRQVGAAMSSYLRSSLNLPGNAWAAIKSRVSLYRSVPVMRMLEQQNIRHIILSGVFEASRKQQPCVNDPNASRQNDAHYETACVSHSAKDLADRGYDVTVVAEATNRAYLLPLSLEERRAIHGEWNVAVDTIGAIAARMAPLRPVVRLPSQQLIYA